MKDFFARNLALLAGILLPVILVAVFFVAGYVSEVDVPDPQYDAIFATNYNSNYGNVPYDIKIKDGKLVISEREADKPYYGEPVLYIFDHATLQAVRLDIDFDNIVDGKVSDATLDKLNAQSVLIDKPASPDGYTFESNYHGGGNFFSEIFGYGHRRSSHVLKRDGRSIPITGPNYIYPSEFIGWKKDKPQ